MSDLLIENMKMPKTCNQCFFTRHCDAHARQVQKMKESKHEQVFDVFGEMRLDDCPLVEVKGVTVNNLIDAQELAFGLYANKMKIYLEKRDGHID